MEGWWSGCVVGYRAVETSELKSLRGGRFIVAGVDSVGFSSLSFILPETGDQI